MRRPWGGGAVAPIINVTLKVRLHDKVVGRTELCKTQRTMGFIASCLKSGDLLFLNICFVIF